LHSLTRANPDVPTAYEPDLPEVSCEALRVCRDLGRSVTVAELAARLGCPAALAGVVVTDLAALDLVRVLRGPARAERLRAWAGDARSVPAVPSVVKLLVVGADEECTHEALTQMGDAGPWLLPKVSHVEISTAHVSEDLELLALGVTRPDCDGALWHDLCREAFGAVVTTGADPCDLAMADEVLPMLAEAGIPVTVLITDSGEQGVATDVVRACLGLSEHTPLVVGDLRGRGVRDAVMDLCSSLMGEGDR